MKPLIFAAFAGLGYLLFKRGSLGGVLGNLGGSTGAADIGIGGGETIPLGKDTEYGRSVLNYDVIGNINLSGVTFPTIAPGYSISPEGVLTNVQASAPQQSYIGKAGQTVVWSDSDFAKKLANWQYNLTNKNLTNQQWKWEVDTAFAGFAAQRTELTRIGYTNIS